MVANSSNLRIDAINEYIVYTTSDFVEQAKQVLSLQ